MRATLAKLHAVCALHQSKNVSSCHASTVLDRSSNLLPALTARSGAPTQGTTAHRSPHLCHLQTPVAVLAERHGNLAGRWARLLTTVSPGSLSSGGPHLPIDSQMLSMTAKDSNHPESGSRH